MIGGLLNSKTARKGVGSSFTFAVTSLKLWTARYRGIVLSCLSGGLLSLALHTRLLQFHAMSSSKCGLEPKIKEVVEELSTASVLHQHWTLQSLHRHAANCGASGASTPASAIDSSLGIKLSSSSQTCLLVVTPCLSALQSAEAGRKGLGVTACALCRVRWVGPASQLS